MVVPPMKNESAWHLFCFGSELNFPAQSDLFSIEDNSESEHANEDSHGDSEAEEHSIDEIFAKLKRRRIELSDNPQDVDKLPRESTAAGVWDGLRGVPPSLDLLLQFDQVLVQRLLIMQTSWMTSSYGTHLVTLP